MTYKPTVFGAKTVPPATVVEPTTSMSPTRLGSLPATTLGVPPAVPEEDGTHIHASPGATTPPAKVMASTVPGVAKNAITVSLDALAVRYSGESPHALAAVRDALQSVYAETYDLSQAMNLGLATQQACAALVSRRVQLLDQECVRSIPRHLARLQRLLSDVLDSFGGGLLSTHPKKVWARIEGEVHQLESLLAGACDTLISEMSGLAELKQTVAQSLFEAHTQGLVADYLAEQVPNLAGTLVARLTALQSTEAMLLEQKLSIEQDDLHFQQLIATAQDGVLIKLPAVRLQLAGLPDKYTDTQRFLAVEKLHEVTEFLERKATWQCSK